VIIQTRQIERTVISNIIMASQKQDKILRRDISNVKNASKDESVLDNRKRTSKVMIYAQKATSKTVNRTTNYNNEVVNDNHNIYHPNISDTLIPIDYNYRGVTLPLIFVNKATCGSLHEQFLSVKEDIEEVIQYFVDGCITPTEKSISKFFAAHPGTMIYSPQLVRTIISLEQTQVSNRMCNQNITSISNEE